MSAPGPVVHVGIDENGLGPRLGPLLVTAVAARGLPGAPALLAPDPRGALGARIGDSKQLVSFGDTALGEAWARALAHTAGLTEGGAGPDALLHALSIDSRRALEAPCPEQHAEQCWGTAGESFVAEPSQVDTLLADVARLRERGLEVLGAHIAIVCTKRLNESAARGVSRFDVDLHTMERLIVHAHGAVGAREGGELDVTCGKVGGYNRYVDAFGPLAGRLVTTLEEGRARSAYAFPGLGRVAFVRDADASHLLVALASLVGKWARDLLTRRVTAYHRAYDATLPEVSGYHDPVTRRFVEASALSRKARGVPDDCFERRSRAGAKAG